ncbi:MAG: SHOCT domain-containing protein [Lutibacter sp.]
MWYECNNDWHYFGMHGIWWLFWVIVLIVIFLVLKPYLIGKKGKDSSLEILRRKYASGDISTEEFEERKRVLKEE